MIVQNASGSNFSGNYLKEFFSVSFFLLTQKNKNKIIKNKDRRRWPTFICWCFCLIIIGPCPAAFGTHVYSNTTDGCPSDDTTTVHQPFLLNTDGSHTAAVRCCQASTGICESDDIIDGNSPCLGTGKTYDQAVAACALGNVSGGGWTLCTMAQINDNWCCDTGCDYDGQRIWSADLVNNGK